MTTALPQPAAAYVQAINSHDSASFPALFAETAKVDDAGRLFQGREAIREWGDKEIFAADVTLDVLGVQEQNGEVVLTTKVDGTFDRTGLPDPLIMDHAIKSEGGRITELACRLTRI